MAPIKATVKEKRLQLDVPADWPDGIEVEIQPLAGGPGGNGERARSAEEAASRSVPAVLDVVSRFRELARQWKDATEFTSSSTEMMMHPAYQQIIGMGPAALPLLIEELRRDPDHWFAALKAISGEDPVPPEDRGKVPRMVQAWLAWGEQRGY